jgi:hypothetical protein
MEYALLDSMRRRFVTISKLIAYLEHGAPPPQDHTTELPADVQFLIARKLLYKDIYSLSRTSKEWNLFDEKYNVMWATLYRIIFPLDIPLTYPRGPVLWCHLFHYQGANVIERIGVQKFFRARFNSDAAKCVKFKNFGGKSKRAQVTAKEINDAWDTLMKTRPLEPVNAKGRAPMRLVDVGPAAEGMLVGTVIELNSIINPVRDTPLSFGFAEFIGDKATTRGPIKWHAIE